ncbi:CHASE2 domain-containing protein [Aetokthonos hydrillicola Thurmond2011]|jgi:CHASE2 domain-containing sensor protein|uniref:CHASE2 domain-containing protein n=1 Tax=Aetokthonos hydrillicola Thurmond2011 TaxID=2712845 RepID=A0AAP5MDB6_9CYAN|nr:CHASE2 domain-containing protein [Aetokthonos hydrillicola]MBO3459591.1 CHASE2 domain-containing protein [Aetokthonos hydrillicola CCALA 1050]MBW4590957.1 CHASE2 domain-containing protein [Aetokthonos hydrillicola CCALA 1050]MDR9899373.1 CHASE2 domain-containing protein [Aetokthonos hydrillicola Thurmond2011]
MAKLVVLKLDGDFQQGFRVTLEIGLEGERPQEEMLCNLPPAEELIEQYICWQLAYRSLGNITRIIKPGRAKVDGCLKKKKKECDEQANKLCTLLNTWLKTESFRAIRERCLEQVDISEEMRLMIRADNYQIWQLPWHKWDLLESYNQVEIGFSSLTFKFKQPQTTKTDSQITILAILGNSKGIQVNEDKQLLVNLPVAKTTFLVEPQRQQLNDQLWEQPWNILFFAGHTQTEDKIGTVHLNQTDSFNLDELKYALQKAIDGGLQLAIFNSCDGLGLARELQELRIPQIIIMREPVPDQVAQEFLKYFLQAFAGGKSFYSAVQEARQRLQGLEDKFPCASWLPIICQHPNVVPLTWPKPNSLPSVSSTRDNASIWSRLLTVFVTSLVVTSFVTGARLLGVLQTLELKTYDLLLPQRPPEPLDNRILMVGADEPDIQHYKYPLSDAVLVQVIEKLEQYQPVAIGIDIFRDLPVSPNHQMLIAQLKQNKHLFTVCSIGDSKETSVASPPNSPPEQIGFNDLESDPDDTVRRHLLSRSLITISSCNTEYSFSLQLADRYLESKGIQAKITPEKNWQFGSLVVKRLEPHTGGYQNLDAQGNQMLINYRAIPEIARQVTLRDVLTGNLKSEWVKNRVILIGVTAASVPDYHDTPYGKMRGLEVHAHLISQILSAVEDGRPLIWWLPEWMDVLWILFWSLTGGIVVLLLRLYGINRGLLLVNLLLVPCTGVTVLYGTCWFLLLKGGWLPLVPAAIALLVTSSAMTYVYILSAVVETEAGEES